MVSARASWRSMCPMTESRRVGSAARPASRTSIACSKRPATDSIQACSSQSGVRSSPFNPSDLNASSTTSSAWPYSPRLRCVAARPLQARTSLVLIQPERLLVVSDKLVEVGQSQPDLGIGGHEFRGPREMEDGLLVRVQPLRALARATQVLDRSVARLAEVEVAREQIDSVLARPIELLCDRGHFPMELAAPAAKEPGVGHVLDEGMVEDDHVDAAVRATVEQSSRHKLLEPLVQGAVACNGPQERERHAAPDHRGGLEKRRGGSRKQVDARREDFLDRCRQAAGVPARLHEPVCVRPDEDSRVLERAQQLLHEEWVPGRAPDNEGDQVPRRKTLEHALCEGLDSLLRELSEPDRGALRPKLVEEWLGLVPGDEVEQHRSLGRRTDEVGGEGDARGVGPMEVLEGDDDRSLIGQRCQPGGERLVETPPESLRLEAGNVGVAWGQPEQPREVATSLFVGDRFREAAL